MTGGYAKEWTVEPVELSAGHGAKPYGVKINGVLSLDARGQTRRFKDFESAMKGGKKEVKRLMLLAVTLASRMPEGECMKVMNNLCTMCGMTVKAKEYHPYAACLMYRQCRDAETVKANLQAVIEWARKKK